ncbi:hypothetical protein GWN63_03925 [Candidatus Bathyarchaeota archaeon]|nr:hypothetical protein [Candidatus Bathyarchaeota archaeon]NIU81378.1 hypothetical protein [Candidatus Bathyarchaeota archaeon]NIV67998.1 hypothetical protein [Candidatus Bathyarchaeota archaeon]NIW34538.1 hypothetical protein [Candidatus Bathyarchaeota archaeon]
MLKESQVQDCRLVDIRGTPQGSTRHLVSVSSAELHKLPKDVFADDPSKRTGRETSFWFDTQGCEICRAILSQGSFLISGRNVEGYTCVYSFITPSAHTFQKIVSTLESVGLKIQILDARKFSPKGEILTERQERTLWLALRMGFFEFPRKLTMQELANRLGIALSTVSEIIRRGTRRLLEKHFET